MENQIDHPVNLKRRKVIHFCYTCMCEPSIFDYTQCGETNFITRRIPAAHAIEQVTCAK